MCCNIHASLVEAQAANIARLQCELDACIESGDEYHAAMIRDDIVVAGSLSRLVHTHNTMKQEDVIK